MSKSTIDNIKERIEATKHGMAIFSGLRIGESAGSLDCVFADTIECNRLISTGNKYYICTLHKSMGKRFINNALNNAIHKSKAII